MAEWISTVQLASIAKITRRAASKVALNAERGINWRGHALCVRVVPAPAGGGAAGRRCEFRVTSLPPGLQAAFYGSQKSLQLSLKLDAAGDADRAWKEALLSPALKTEPGTPERRAAVRTIIAAEHIRRGQRITVPERTVQRWLAEFDKHGLGGLTRKKRTDAGKSAVVLSRSWDAATKHLSDGVRKRIAAELAQRRRNLWGNGFSYIDVKRLSSEFLADATADAGTNLSDAELRAACELPKHVVEIDRDVRDVHEYRTDRKSWDDKRPRMALTSDGLAPMQIVYGDVHHFDIYLEREDGSKATPKGIAWLDAATRRVRMDIVLCEPNTAVRNADLIDSFIAMTQDPYWGMPAKLYLDNGSEYGFADFAKDALHLAGLDCFTFGKSGTITRAQAYNAAAKGIIEGSFRSFEQLMATLPGYIGGDRMKSRSANLGKAPIPWPGDFDMFCNQHDGVMRYWMTRQQTGDLKGASPEQMLTRLIEAGWERTDIDEFALRAAFSIEQTRVVTDGKISVPKDMLHLDEAFPYSGKLHCDELAAFTGQTVRVRLPKYQTWSGVPVYTSKGNTLIGIAMPEHVRRRDDPAGALDAAWRKKEAIAAIKTKAATVEPIDAAAVMAKSARRQALPPVPKSKGKIRLPDDMATVGRQVTEDAPAPSEHPNQKKQRLMRERIALLTRHAKGDQP